MVKIRYPVSLGFLVSVFSADIVVRLVLFLYPCVVANALAEPNWWALFPFIFVCPIFVPCYAATLFAAYVSFLFVRSCVPYLSWAYFLVAVVGSYMALILHFLFWGAGTNGVLKLFFSKVIVGASLFSGFVICVVAWILLRLFFIPFSKRKSLASDRGVKICPKGNSHDV